MAFVGMTVSRAEDKTEKMKSKAQALDQMIDSGVLTDYTSNKNDIESELEKTTIKGSVEEELAKLRSERAKRRNEANRQEMTQEIEENKTNQDEKTKEEEEEEEAMVNR